MNTLALSDEILLTIDKPARYIGNELNMVKKNPKDVDIRFAMCFPDVYEIGMSHLGIQILYDMFNKRDDVYCERVYSPWPDLHKIMKAAHEIYRKYFKLYQLTHGVQTFGDCLKLAWANEKKRVADEEARKAEKEVMKAALVRPERRSSYDYCNAPASAYYNQNSKGAFGSRYVGD